MFEAAKALIQIVKVGASTAAGAIDPHVPVTFVTSAGAEARSLKNGSPGALKAIVAFSYGGEVTITPANLANGTTVVLGSAGACWIGYMFQNEWVTVHTYGTVTVS
jgi:hypothetical protein